MLILSVPYKSRYTPSTGAEVKNNKINLRRCLEDGTHPPGAENNLGAQRLAWSNARIEVTALNVSFDDSEIIDYSGNYEDLEIFMFLIFLVANQIVRRKRGADLQVKPTSSYLKYYCAPFYYGSENPLAFHDIKLITFYYCFTNYVICLRPVALCRPGLTKCHVNRKIVW